MKKLQKNKRIKPVQTEQLQHNDENIYQLVDLCGASSTIKIQWAYTKWNYIQYDVKTWVGEWEC